MDRHVWEVAKARIVVSDGKVVSVGEPKTKFCPIIHAMMGEHERTVDNIRESMETRIEAFGLSTPRRVLEAEEFGVGFGASECLATALREKILETTVTVCDGAGTIIAAKPSVVQGVGMIMSALIETTPIPELVERLEREGITVLDPTNATIDQVGGVERAFEMGYRKVGVTVMGPDARMISVMRELEEKNGATLLIIVIHTTGIGKDMVPFIEKADIVHACASKIVRELIAPKAKVTFGKSIPVYALTELGERVLGAQEKMVVKTGRILEIGTPKSPSPLS